MTEPPMLMVGLMSGTSLDGVDAALVRISSSTALELVHFVHRPYSVTERGRIAAILEGRTIREVALLHASVSHWACEAVDALLAAAHVRADTVAAIAFPGQTAWHEPPNVSFALGEPAILAERFGVRVVHGFRARDVAAGGQGAPLVPIADALCFGAPDHARVLLNVGGMANVTWVGRRGVLDDVVGADTGPGMAVIDGVARLVNSALPYDVDGELAARGVVDPVALSALLADPFFATPPPRSTGREHFGADYASALHARVPGVDGVRTAVALTAESIAMFCTEYLPAAPEMVVAGGGVHHPVLMELLRNRMARHQVVVRRFDELFFSGDAKEAVAFALLAWLTLHGQPGNLTGVTGARGIRVLGAITPG
ncbi:MAG: anhydro-N-acetylmuramic acid kinase [Gemmatimonadales bacterium]